MKNIVFAFMGIFLIGNFATANGTFLPEQSLSEEAKIDLLIEAIGDLKGAKFLRNGDTHSASKAASHLKRKMRWLGGDIETARQFINEMASESSSSGEKYYIIFSNGKKVTSRSFLLEKLEEIENE